MNETPSVRAFLMVALVHFGAAADATMAQRLEVGELVSAVFESPHPYPQGGAGGGEGATVVASDTIHQPGATYIAVHFAELDVGKGDYVIVRSSDHRQVWRYEGTGKLPPEENSGNGWFAAHIKGDMAIVELFAHDGPGGYGYRIDGYGRGFTANEMSARKAAESAPAICGVDDTREAKCYRDTEPTIYGKSRAVARLLIDGVAFCTGWLVGSDGHLMTNSHCIGDQNDAINTDFEFMAEGESCLEDCTAPLACAGTVVASGALLEQSDVALDYSLVRLPVNVSAQYGYLRMRTSGAQAHERFYMPQHPEGWGKRIAVESSHPFDDPPGFPRIFGLEQPTCTGGLGDVGYWADGLPGSSGSPIVGFADHLVVAIHHCRGDSSCSQPGGEPNRGVPIDAIINHLGSNLPPDSVANGTPPSPPQPPCSGDTTPPDVSLTSPPNAANYEVGASVPLAAVASDPGGGTIDRVEFTVDGSVVATATTSSYSGTWTPSSEGSYQVAARAFDACQNDAISPSHTVQIDGPGAPPGPGDATPPTVSLDSPPDQAELNEGSIHVVASATDASGIDRVEFFRNGLNQGVRHVDDDGPPYEWFWEAIEGQHALRARAVDASPNANSSLSAVHFVNVASTTGPPPSPPPPSGCGSPPMASVVEPGDGSTHMSGVSIMVRADASDDVAITKVEFYRNFGDLIGTRTAPPYEISWTPGGVGSPKLTAKAYDACTFTQSATITIHVVSNPCTGDATGPDVEITWPEEGELEIDAATEVRASATDPSGVDYVDFYGMGTVVRDLDAPWVAAWTDPDLGPAYLWTRAVDTCGNANESDTVYVEVVEQPSPEQPPEP